MSTLCDAVTMLLLTLTHDLASKPAAEATHIIRVHCRCIINQLLRLQEYKTFHESSEAGLLPLYDEAIQLLEITLATIKEHWPEFYQEETGKLMLKPIEWNWNMKEVGSLLAELKEHNAYKGPLKHAIAVTCQTGQFGPIANANPAHMANKYNDLSFGSQQTLLRFYDGGGDNLRNRRA
jgi:hypothetical protein